MKPVKKDEISKVKSAQFKLFWIVSARNSKQSIFVFLEFLKKTLGEKCLRNGLS